MLIGIIIAVAILLLVPLVAMQFTDQVVWTLFDFVTMGCLLLITGLVVVLVRQKTAHKAYRIVGMAAVLLAAILVWTELSVGIFGSPIAGT
jgi:hypothetical protein